MSIPLTINGSTYAYPQTGNRQWGPSATAWAQAVTVGMLQKAGGTFTLTAEVDFGALFGLKSIYYKSGTGVNIAQSGLLRQTNADLITWRNAANDGDNTLGVSPTDELLYNGLPIGGGSTTLDGDVSGPTDNNTVDKIKNIDVSIPVHGAAQDGYVLTYINGTTNLQLKPVSSGSLPLGGDLSGTTNLAAVLSITGSAGIVNIASTGQTLRWSESTIAPTISQVPKSSGNGANMSIGAQVAISPAIGGDLDLYAGNGGSLNAGNVTVAGNIIQLGIDNDDLVVVNNDLTVRGMTTGIVHSNVTGELTSSLIVNADITNATITLPKLATQAAHTFVANNTGSPASPTAITATAATAELDVFTSLLKGLAPASGGGTTNFLRADGTWATPTASITWADDLAGSTNTNQYVAEISGAGGMGGSVPFTAASLDWAGSAIISGTNASISANSGDLGLYALAGAGEFDFQCAGDALLQVGGKLTITAGNGIDITAAADPINITSGQINIGQWVIGSGKAFVQVDLSNGRLEQTRTPIYTTVNKISNYTIVSGTDNIIFVKSDGGSFTITLPPTPEPGESFTIKDEWGFCATNPVTIDGNGLPIDSPVAGITTYDLNINFQSITVVYNSSFNMWSII